MVLEPIAIAQEFHSPFLRRDIKVDAPLPRSEFRKSNQRPPPNRGGNSYKIRLGTLLLAVAECSRPPLVVRLREEVERTQISPGEVHDVVL